MRRLALSDAVSRIDWPLTFAMATTGFMLVGICAIAVGLMHDPLMAEFKWKNGAASGLATVYSLSALLSGPVAGVLIDRLGSKHVMTAGIWLVALGFLGMSFCNTLIGFYAAFVLIGVGYGGAFFLASTKIIATRMGDQKNIGMGIWMFAGSSGAALFSVVVNWSLRTQGWRATCVAAAVLILGAVPLTLFLVPRDPLPEVSTESAAEWRRLPPKELMLSHVFLVMTAASAFAAFGMSAIYFHTVPILVKAGFSDQSASSILGASWILSAVGSLFSGVISDRIGSRRVLAGSLFFGAIGTAALLLAQSQHLGMLAVIAFIVLWGATANAINQFLPLLLVEHYGPSHLGALVGLQGALMGLVGSFAPLITGSLYDRYSSYWPAIIAGVVTTLAALLLVMRLKRANEAPLPDESVNVAAEPTTFYK